MQFTKQLQKYFTISFTKNNRVNQFRLYKLDLQPKIKFMNSNMTVIKAHSNDNDYSTDDGEYHASKEANIKDLLDTLRVRKTLK